MTTDYVTLTDISGRDIYPVTDLAAINMTVTNGIAVVQTSGGTIGIRDGYIESSYFTNMTSQGIGAATIGETYIDGGTMFQLIGGYTVTDEIPPITGASHDKVPSEYSVRSAIDALATVGPSMAPGAGIVMETTPGSTGGTIAVAPGNGINVATAQTGGVSVKAKTSGGLSVTADGVAVNVGNGLEIDGNNAVRVSAKTSGGLAVDNTGVRVVAGNTMDLTGGTVNAKVADVDEVLTSRVTGSTVQDDVEEVTPGNLRGALSVGQAVDVTCMFGETNMTGQTSQNYLAASYTLTKATGTASNGYFGWTTGTSAFPKFATGLKYLWIFDLTNNSGSSILFKINSCTAVPGFGNATVANGETKRFAVTDIDSNFFISGDNTKNIAMSLVLNNCRQYEVTALTDDAIAYLAGYGQPGSGHTPDDLFRSSTVFQVRDKYLVKQDMVCPWIYTIPMDDNSDLTVGAGLSYKIKYTDNPVTPHQITVDTIPADAYGWDAHIQMFIKGTSAVQFKPPLILMDALTPNAGNNLAVKFRNGDALVYVEDTNAGNIVLYATGTTAGTLYYSLQQNPGSGYDNYIIFAQSTDNLVCDAGVAGVSYDTAILGNGADTTTITGVYDVTDGKTLTWQNMSVSGCTLNGVGGTILRSTNVINGLKILLGSTGTFAGTNTLNSTVSGEGAVAFADGATVTSTIPSGSTIGTGVIGTQVLGGTCAGKSLTLEGITITGSTTDGCIFSAESSGTITLKNCNITGNLTHMHSGNSQGMAIQVNAWDDKGKIILENVTISGNTHTGQYPSTVNKVFCRQGTAYITSVMCAQVVFHVGTAIIAGDNSWQLGWASSTSSNCKIVLTPNSIVRTNQASVTRLGTSMFYVGTYDESTGAVTTTGTATVVLNGTTVNVSGSGTTIDSTGLHS